MKGQEYLVLVTHVSQSDFGGGASIAAVRLHLALRRAGVDSQMYVRDKRSTDSSVLRYQLPARRILRVRQRLSTEWLDLKYRAQLRNREPGMELFTTDQTSYGRNMVKQMPDCDLINLHWVAGFVDYTTFFTEVATQVPLVWTLHDMNPLTGGCHYTFNCNRYEETCGECPQLGSARIPDLSTRVWQRKQKSYAQIPERGLHIVTPSRWLAGKAQHSALLSNYPITVIPNGVDTTVFSPRDRALARAALEIPSSAHVILFGAASMQNRRKGFRLLNTALNHLGDCSDLWLLSFGGHQEPLEGSMPHIHVGHVENERWLALIYSAADLFVIPSLEDNLPNTVLESMACGTPVIGFDVGGIPEMVRPELSGDLVPAGDVAALGRALSRLLRDSERRQRLSEGSRRLVEQEYSLMVLAERYTRHYQDVLERFRAS